MGKGRFIRTLILLAVVSAGCAPAGLTQTATPSPASVSPTASPQPAPVTGSLADRAVSDLAERLGVPVAEIEVVSEEDVTWSDSSLGCPQPGMNYTQALVEGRRIVLKHGAETYDYHAGSSSLFLCEQPAANPPLAVATLDVTPEIEQGAAVAPTVSVSADLQPLVDQAVADLAQRLSVEPAEIELVEFESVMWPDSSLGCPNPDMAYLQVLTEGYRIQLRVDKRPYAYHGGQGRAPFYCETPAR